MVGRRLFSSKYHGPGTLLRSVMHSRQIASIGELCLAIDEMPHHDR
jgi:hypothetical protein